MNKEVRKGENGKKRRKKISKTTGGFRNADCERQLCVSSVDTETEWKRRDGSLARYIRARHSSERGAGGGGDLWTLRGHREKGVQGLDPGNLDISGVRKIISTLSLYLYLKFCRGVAQHHVLSAFISKMVISSSRVRRVPIHT